jgi:hypothetical protein
MAPNVSTPNGSFDDNGYGGRESAFHAMSPNFERKGVAIDDWNNDQKQQQQQRYDGEYADQSADGWYPGLDSFNEFDWTGLSRDKVVSTMNETNLARTMDQFDDEGHRRLPTPQSEPSHDAYSSAGPIDADDVYFSMTAEVKQNDMKPVTMEKPQPDSTDTPTKKLKDWRNSQGKSSKPVPKAQTYSAPVALEPTKDFVFDPFDDPFESKVDNTETTDPTDGTDLFGSPDPFFGDLGSFAPPPNVIKPIARSRDVIPQLGSYHSDEFIASVSNSNKNGQPSLFAELAPPSGTFDDSKEEEDDDEEEEEVKNGSKDEVWSCDIGLGMSDELDNIGNNPVVYDADTSDLNDTAVEI